MSKRVANTRERTARNGRVRIGWRKQRMLEYWEDQEQRLSHGWLDEQAQAAFNVFKREARRLIPQQFLRRVQGR